MRWFEKFAQWIERNGGCREILRNDGDMNDLLYMKRYYIAKTPWFEIMLHQFFKSDVGGLHNHPSWSFGWILAEGYRELIAKSLLLARAGYYLTRETYPGSFGYRPGNDTVRSFHKVTLRPGTKGKVWSLFVMGPRRPEPWGFMEPYGFIPFSQQYLKDGIMHSSPNDYKGWLFPRRA